MQTLGIRYTDIVVSGGRHVCRCRCFRLVEKRTDISFGLGCGERLSGGCELTRALHAFEESAEFQLAVDFSQSFIIGFRARQFVGPDVGRQWYIGLDRRKKF